MKQLVTLLAVVALGLFVYKHHTDRMRAISERGAVEAGVRKPKPLKLHGVRISRVVEPLYLELFSALDQHNPTDLVPPLEITKERILDMQSHAEPEKQVVYARGVTLLDAMISLAEDRTRILVAILKTAQGKSPLDSPSATSSSTSFFTQTTVKKWEEEKKRRRARIDQLFTILRTAERDWNKHAGKNAPFENYDLPRNLTVPIILDQPASPANPLERRAYDQRRVTSPWRQDYYDRYRYQ